MTALVHLDAVSVEIGSRSLFQNIRLVLGEKARVGIIGPNGAGKSTLLKIAAGLLEPDAGRRIVQEGTRVAYVPQMESFDESLTVSQVVLHKLDALEKSDDNEVAAAKALSQAGFTDRNQPVSELSGGWRKRLSLASALASEPELLLLDEPTNHLDVDGLSWLEKLLRGARFAWALVSHDRYFLDRTVERIFELSPHFPDGHFQSDGGYFTFKAKRDEFLEQEAKRTSALANRTRRELDWASRSPKARTGKAAYRMKQAAQLKEQLREAKSRVKQDQKVTSFQSAGRDTRELVQLIKVSFSYETQQILDQLSYTITNRTCLGLLGTNGQGKSTLLKIIGGTLEPNGGKVKIVHGLRVVYFDQLRESLSEWKKLGELLGEGHDHVIYRGKPVHIIGWGRRFGFEASDHEKLVTSLSGGEQARALLSILVRQEADLLLLDEPTNDLDIAMLEALESMILEFEGAVVLVTHDRFMLDEVCTAFLGFDREGTLTEYASYDQWAAERLQKSPPSEKEEASSSDSSEKRKPILTKLSYNDQREYGQIEGKIEKAEEKLEAVESRIADPTSHADPEQSRTLAEELAHAKHEVETLYARWEELEELKRIVEENKRK